jgi:GMP synthase (glutamine-hydrolysing)
LHWHGDTFDLPASCQHLAATDVTINQAWSFGNTALGLQFHLEIAAAEIEQWLIGHAHEIATTPGVSHQKLRQDTANYGAALATSAANCMSSWLQQFA